MMKFKVLVVLKICHTDLACLVLFCHTKHSLCHFELFSCHTERSEVSINLKSLS